MFQKRRHGKVDFDRYLIRACDESTKNYASPKKLAVQHQITRHDRILKMKISALFSFQRLGGLQRWLRGLQAVE